MAILHLGAESAAGIFVFWGGWGAIYMARKRVPYLSVVRTVDKKDRPFNAKTTTRKVPDPWSPDGGYITVTASMRDDPLSRLHTRNQIEPHQHAVALALQAEFEAVEISGAKSVDFGREGVDGGGAYREPFGDRQRHAGNRLAQARAKLGKDSFGLLQLVLGERVFLAQVAAARGWHPRIAARRFKVALESLAELWGYTGQAPGRRLVRDKFSAMAAEAIKPKVAEAAEAA
jgi:hypothetical protein